MIEEALDIINLAKEWFGKPQNKIEYDAVRQQVWDAGASLVGQVDGYRASGELTTGGLGEFIDAMQILMTQFKSYTDTVSSSIGSDWVQPRFHDYYDFFNGVIQQWKKEVVSGSLPSDSWIDALTGGGTEPDVMPMPSQITNLMPTYKVTPTQPSAAGSTSLAAIPWTYIGLALIGYMLLKPSRRIF